jgi:glyoxylase-like metal-dependent hydrolase (beta-lactamase superfamily II)
MDKPSKITIVNVGYRSTNYWVVSADKKRLIIDLGWPGTMGIMRANLKRMDVPLDELQYCLATHYHIDHAGLAQEFKQAGVPLLVLHEQSQSIPLMKTWIKSENQHTEITLNDNITISSAESRQLLGRIGIPGEILHTSGHSEDSVSLLLDDGSAFTGDLTHPEFIGEEDEEIVSASWRWLRERGATTVYPGHGLIRQLHTESNA